MTLASCSTSSPTTAKRPGVVSLNLVPDLEAAPLPAPEPEPPARPGEFGAVDIGPINVWPPVVLAPMAGVTNAPFRTLCRRFGAGLYVNQMITARALVEGHRKSLELAAFAPDESPRSIQLYGTDPYSIRRSHSPPRRRPGRRHPGRSHRHELRLPDEEGHPSRRRRRAPVGASTIARSSSAVQNAGDVPVTVKFRVGIDDDAITFIDAGRIAEDEGVKAVALHARTANQLYSGHADWAASPNSRRQSPPSRCSGTATSGKPTTPCE